MGDTIPADIRVFEAMNLAADEQSLTGESLPVEKIVDCLENTELGIGDRINIAYGTTTVQKGRGRGIVISTGMQTEVGKIAAVSDNQNSHSGYQHWSVDDAEMAAGSLLLAHASKLTSWC